MAGVKEMKKERNYRWKRIRHMMGTKEAQRQAGEGGVKIKRGSKESEVQITVLRCSDSLVVTFVHSKYRW